MASDTVTVDPPRESAVQSRIAAIVGSPWSWLAFFAIAFGFHIGRAMLADPPRDPPPVLYTMPEFQLTDQFGREFGSRELVGKIWVANFIFTHCPTRCNDLTESMKKVQKRLKYMRDGVYLTSFSVDPEHDTPERLLAYAKKHEAKQSTWRFLTGELGAVQAAVVDGFKQPIAPGEPLPADDEMPVGDRLMNITHGTRFVLVDRQHRIRGYYETDEASLDDLLGDIALVGLE
ncbi:MAG: SCO family protein [Deltaproteobacteria bacterium]|jgi:protein SCO1/2